MTPLIVNMGIAWLSLISRESPSIRKNTRQKQASLQTFTRMYLLGTFLDHMEVRESL